MNKSAASAASTDYVKFQAVIKSAASAASLGNGSTTHLKKKHFPSFFAGPGPRPGPGPGAQARAPAKKDGKSKLAAEKIVKK